MLMPISLNKYACKSEQNCYSKIFGASLLYDAHWRLTVAGETFLETDFGKILDEYFNSYIYILNLNIFNKMHSAVLRHEIMQSLTFVEFNWALRSSFWYFWKELHK